MALKRKEPRAAAPIPKVIPKVVPKRRTQPQVDLVAVRELINRRRRQLMVHSELYYRMNENLITDHDFDRWSKELVELQTKYPQIAAECVFAAEFKSFDGSTGFHLCGNLWGAAKAHYLLQTHRKGIAG